MHYKASSKKDEEAPSMRALYLRPRCPSCFSKSRLPGHTWVSRELKGEPKSPSLFATADRSPAQSGAKGAPPETNSEYLLLLCAPIEKDNFSGAFS